MKEFENNAYFWQKVDALFLSGDFKITYKKGTVHPKYPGLVFPFDYGRVITLESDSNSSLRVMKSKNGSKINAIVVCANLLDRNVNVVGLVGMNEEEENIALSFLNQNDFQKTVVIRRGKTVPDWTIIE